ncbi:anti-sigma factor [Actinomadura hibisca]|uniref:anti-sigma factor n=1 Tax=Actinomadura hibisca TaxID=68565 RepID=UPI0012FBC488|nr:anti-sigma factor [Actinomadura hibisca]
MGATDCAYRLDLGAYALGGLPGAEAAALRAHLPRCPPCRTELAAFGKVTAALGRTRQSAGPPGRTGAWWRVNGACAARGPASST